MIQRPNLVEPQFGSYRLLRLLETGGFAHAYLGECINPGTQATIKVLHTLLVIANTNAFLTEGRTITKLKHSHITQVPYFNIQDSMVLR